MSSLLQIVEVCRVLIQLRSMMRLTAWRHDREILQGEGYMKVKNVCVCIIAMLCIVHGARADGILPDSSTSVPAIASFDECVRQQGKILKSYPARCISKDGREFVQDASSERRACKDLCGDGRCQEIVCMAVGCPCAESPETCSKDCK